MAKGLFAKKSIQSLHEEAADTTRHNLKRTLGAVNLTAFGIGAIIGAGIFVLTGQAAAEYAGPGIVFSFMIAGLICALAALCYAEFASLIPISGSAYSYAYVTMGELAAWVIGWVLTLEYLFSASTIAVGWSGYCVSLLQDFGFEFPKKWASAPFLYDVNLGWERSGAILNLPAMFIVAIIGVMMAIGIKAVTRLNNLMVVIKMSVIILFIACGIAYINAGNWMPLIPENTGTFGQYGFSGILRGAGVVFFAFIGFDAISTLTQETKNPQRDLPIGMLASLGISTLVYIVIALILTGIVSYHLLNVADPIAVAVNALGSKFIWLRFVIKIAILAGLTSGVLVMLLGQTRVFYAMSHDGLFPKVFGKTHPKFQTPFFNSIAVAIVALIVAGLFPVGILAQLVSIGTLLVFGIVCFGVLLLRYSQPDLHRPFKTPLMPWVPILGTLACLGQMLLLPGVTWFQLIGWMVLGCIIYASYGYRHSRVRKV